MANKTNKDTGIFQLDNGCWGYRYVVKIDGKPKERKTVTLLVNLIDILKANYKQTLHDEQYGETLTEEDLKRIDEL